MLLAPLPFDYLKQADPGDRIRRTKTRTTGIRVRRIPAGSDRK